MIATRLRDAVDLIGGSGAIASEPTTWADLGCARHVHTRALAELLAPGSVIHAMDADGSALRRIPSTHERVRIVTHAGDFTNASWLFAGLDGILMATCCTTSRISHDSSPRATAPDYSALPHRRARHRPWQRVGAVSRLSEAAEVALHRRGVFLDPGARLAAVGVSARGDLRSLGDGLKSGPPREFGQSQPTGHDRPRPALRTGGV
jgi:hypothetical protein